MEVIAKEYTIFELNNILTAKFNLAISTFTNIKIKGEITDFKTFKNNSGCSFRIEHNNNSFICRAWNSSKIDIKKIKSFENTTCSIIGNIKQNYFGGRYEFLLDLTCDIIKENDISKIKQLKEICEEHLFFSNKKIIQWQTVKKIGIISKQNTQGYNDFVNQLAVPIDLILKEIILEGNETEKSLTGAINNLQNTVDIIMIIRGGGATIEISNSFDTFNIFKSIKESNVPIVTAIGHESDKDDKLLITTISDYDFPTPSTASLEINKIFVKPVLDKIYLILDWYDKIFYDKINDELINEYDKLKNLFECYMKNKLGGIIVSIANDDEYVIIQKNNKFYKIKIKIKSSDKIDDLNEEIIESKNKITNGINNKNIDTVKNNFEFISKNFNTECNMHITNSIYGCIENIENINEIKNKYKIFEPTKYDNLYCVNTNADANINTNIFFENITKMRNMYNWYVKTLMSNNADKNIVKEILNFFN